MVAGVSLAFVVSTTVLCRPAEGASTVAYNMLRNPGFELRYGGTPLGDYWTGPPEVERTNAGPAQGGKWCLRVSPGGTRRVECSERLPVVPGWMYRTAFFVKSPAKRATSAPVATLTVHWLDSGNHPLAGKPWSAQWRPSTGDWTVASSKQVAPPNARFARISLTFQPQHRPVLCDDVYFGPEQPTTTRFVNESFDAGSLGLAQVAIGPTATAPAIDGALTDLAWKTAARIHLADSATGQKPTGWCVL